MRRYDWRVVAILDDEKQRLATLIQEASNRHVRASLSRRLKYVSRVMDVYVGGGIYDNGDGRRT